MNRIATIGSACCLLALVGCDPAPESLTSTLEPAERAWPEGTPEAVGLLDLLNSDQVDHHFLDDIIALDSRSASAIVHHRNGPDGRFGTRDDDPFDSLTELDSVYYVGERTIEHLLAWADRFGFVPQGSDLLGVYDGVPFTVDEAQATLDFVNGAPYDLLSYDLGLDDRAAAGIIDAQPIGSVLELALVPWVGRATLGVLQSEGVAQSCGQGALRGLLQSIDATDGLGATTDFEWQVVLDTYRFEGDLLGASCYGVPDHYLPAGAVGLDARLPAEEVVGKLAQFSQAAGVAAAQGLEAAECYVDGLDFMSCHLAFQIDEKQGYDQWFYVAEDFALLLQWHWVE